MPPGNQRVVIGTCRLCLIPGVELQRSHYLPAGVYRITRDEGLPNPNPVSVSKQRTVHTSHQLRKHLLCWSCEQRFREYGEDWVLGNCLGPDGTFRLASILSSADPIAADERCKVYCAADIPGVSISALVYFAASVFWRGAVCQWATVADAEVLFGPYEEKFRRYLMHLAPFPKACFLSVLVREARETDRVTVFPHGYRIGTFRIHKFAIPGLAFTLAVGKKVPSEFRNTCLVNGFRNPIVISSIAEPGILRNLQALAALHGKQA